MRGNRQEAEVIVRLDQLDGLCHINVSMWPAMARKMTRMYGPSLDSNRGGNSERWKIPLKAVTFRSLGAIAKRTGRPFPGAKPRGEAHSED